MSPSIGLNLRVTGHCNQGGRKYMEDAFVVAYQQTEDETELEYAYFGIFDGHGGREAALFAKEHLMNNIVSQKNFWSDNDEQVLKAIKDGFLMTHRAMWREVGNWPKTVSGLPSTSGTTSSIAFIRRRKLFIGHVGDSKIVLGYQEPNNPEWSALPLTKDHKPETPKEKQRIYSVGGLVMNKAGVERVVWNRPRPGHKGPVRRSTPVDQIPFLAVARSLGDLWSYNYLRHEFIVSPEPDVTVFNIDTRRDRCVIFASDGLWNMLTTKCAVKIVQKAEEENEKMILEGGGPNGVGKPANNPSQLLVDCALKHWFDLGMRADNTSVVTVMLDPPGPPKCEVLRRQKIMQKLRPRDEQNDDGENEKRNVKLIESSTISNSKERKRLFEPQEPSASKERKRSSDNSEGPPRKERRLSSDLGEPVPKKLPKPVILSAHRVVKSNHQQSNQPAPNTPPKTPPKENKPVNDVNSHTTAAIDVKVHKKGHEPLGDGENKADENKSTDAIPSVTDVASGASCAATPSNSNNGIESSPVDVSKSVSPTNCSQKENGRTHLCEVDNIVKSPKECPNKPTSKTELSRVVAKQKVKKSALKSLSLRKKLRTRYSDLSKTVNMFHNLRLNRDGGWKSSSSRTLLHNTRSNNRLRKMKV